MKTTILVACIAALLPAGALAATPPPASAAQHDQSDMFAAPTQVDRVGRIVVHVFINGKGPFRFLVDTGADGSMISQALVRTLGLTSNNASDVQVQGTTGVEQLPCVTIDDLRIGSIVKHNIHMPVSPSPVMTGLGGILGLAGFGPVRVLVNFHSNRVEIEPSSNRRVEGYLGIQARRTSGGLLMVPALVGDVPVEAVIDTGAAETLGNTALREALLRRARHPEDARIYGVTKQIGDGGISASPWLTLGPVVVQSLGIVYSDIPIFKIWHLDSQPALIIGMNVLGSVDALVLDYPRAQVYLRPQQTGVSIDKDYEATHIEHEFDDDGN
ncbi:MAG: aspartyl protease family protein [Steroidobacteraceae bacterium]